MGAEQSKPKGPDLTRGVPVGDVADVRPQPSVTNPRGAPYSWRSRSGRL